jgi:hypothetical protein
MKVINGVGHVEQRHLGWTSSTNGGPWTGGVSLTSANLDAYNGLQDPATNARFAPQN